MRSPVMLFILLIAFIALPQPAAAQTQDLDVQVTVLGHAGTVAGGSSEHFLTFSAPVGVPGVGLAPGAYVFRIITPSVMQVLNADRSMAYAIFFVAPASRSEITDEYAVTLQRIRTGAPARITKLFPAGASTGFEFIYPEIETTVGAGQVAMR